MKALKVKVYQETAVYRNPVTMEIIESFPLPPPSTILGLLHNIVGAKKTIQGLNVSIQGKYNAILHDYQWYKKYDGKKWQEIYPMIVNTLSEVELLLHISVSDEMIKRLREGFINPPYYLYLGRAEDLIKIVDKPKIVSIQRKEMDETSRTYSAYIRMDKAKKLGIEMKGPLFRLPIYYELKEVEVSKSTISVREFEWIDYVYVENVLLNEEKVYVDGDGDIVWWSMPNQNQ